MKTPLYNISPIIGCSECLLRASTTASRANRENRTRRGADSQREEEELRRIAGKWGDHAVLLQEADRVGAGRLLGRRYQFVPHRGGGKRGIMQTGQSFPTITEESRQTLNICLYFALICTVVAAALLGMRSLTVLKL